MTPERRLAENIRRLNPVSMWLTQGEVVSVDNLTCTVKIGNAVIEGVRLRASLTDREKQILTVPKTGSAVTLGCLTADLNNLVVLQVDEIEKIEINGGQLGGMIKIEDLTDKLNNLVSEVNSLKDTFNNHTHKVATSGSASAQQGDAAPVLSKAQAMSRFNKDDYEDTTITH